MTGILQEIGLTMKWCSFSHISVVIFLLSMITGCIMMPPESPKVAYANAQAKLPKFAVLTTPGVEITAQDNTWKMEHKKIFKPTVWWDANWNNRKLIKNVAIGSDYIDNNNFDQISSEIRKKFIDVLIKVKGGNQPLYGKLIFSNVRISTLDTSAKRMWTVTIPNEYIQIANSGNVARVYQPYSSGSGKDYISWALYLSALPI